jgi:protein-tyrosine phosphatase
VVPDDITVAINVAAEQPNRWDLDCEYLKIGLSTPTEETEQSYTTFAEIVKTILRLVDEGHRIFVYCACGMNRSVSVAATAAARLDNTTVERKIIEIGEQRPEIWPEPFYVVVGQFLNREWE